VLEQIIRPQRKSIIAEIIELLDTLFAPPPVQKVENKAKPTPPPPPAKQEEVLSKGYFCLRFRQQKLYGITVVLFILVNLILGMTSQPIIALIEQGLKNFA
jgi:hypothetical protein